MSVDLSNDNKNQKLNADANISCCPQSSTPCCASSDQTKKFDALLWGSLSIILPLWLIAIIAPEWIAPYPRLSAMAHSIHANINAMWWGVLIGIIAIGLLSKIPRAFIMSILGQGGTISGLLRAVGAGVLLDLCSHGILMVGTKLYEKGASAGQVIAFLLASPWNSFSLTFVLIGLIGFKFTFLFIVLSAAIALSTGLIFDNLVARKRLPANPNTPQKVDQFLFWPEAKSHLKNVKFNTAFFSDIIKSGIRDSQMVVRWLAFGILLAALLRGILSQEVFSQYFGPTILGLMATIFFATILEVCSEGSAPIAADVLTRANAPGNSFAFLMAGVATDYTEVMILKDTTKSWRIALFLPLITVPQVILVAFIINIAAN